MRKSYHAHSFSNIPTISCPRSVFSRSHGHKTTLDAGYLVPFFVDEVLPGDSSKLTHSIFIRATNPLQQPVMDNLYMDTFYFFVPNRLVWDNWQKQQGEQIDPGDSIDYLTPVFDSTGGTVFEAFSVGDYMSMPVQKTVEGVNCLYNRAYNLIWNEWFRDENLQDSIDIDRGDGPDVYQTTAHGLQRRGKRHDYFTSCLPWPQKGPGVEIPLGTSAPIMGDGKTLGLWQGNPSVGMGAFINTGIEMTAVNGAYGLPAGSSVSTTPPATGNLTIGVTPDGSQSGMVADLSSATAATINTLRQAFQIQKVYERDARSGTRYPEILRNHFGVVSPDARLQRPEYLGGSSDRLKITPVVQTSETASTPQGGMTAYVVNAETKRGFKKSFVEHGMVIGLCSIRADLTYQAGLNRMFSRRERFDYYLPSLAHLGEQAVLNKEIYYQGILGVDNEVFGYQERWAEYRYKPSQITGALRSNFSASLDVWHLAEDFGSLPTLSSTFIEDPTRDTFERVSATENNNDQFVMDVYFDYVQARPLPVYSIPGYIDHF